MLDRIRARVASSLAGRVLPPLVRPGESGPLPIPPLYLNQLQRRMTLAERVDFDRTGRLLDAMDTAFDGESADFNGPTFEAVLLEGLMGDCCNPAYPPAGHSYPRPDKADRSAS